MKKYLTLASILFLGACHSQPPQQEEPEKYLRWVGDTEYDEKLDDPNFKPCKGDSVYQYFNFYRPLELKYKGERPALWATYYDNYKPITKASETGLIRIRFIVNCKGEIGWFRMIAMDADYQPKVFDPKITDQLMEITKGLNGWDILPSSDNPADYYQYLIFKLENGEIKEILP